MERATGTRWRKAAGILILLPSLSMSVYAPLLPTPLGPQVVGVGPLGFGFNALSLLGLGGIVAAVGVWRGSRWGRALGAVVTVLLLAWTAWSPFGRLDVPSDPLGLAGYWLSAISVAAVCSAVVLFALARRWTPRDGR